MSTTSIPVYTCDRCGNTEEMRSSHMTYSWGVLVARQLNGPFSVGNGTNSDGKIKGADLCPTCVATLKSWWTVGRDAKP